MRCNSQPAVTVRERSAPGRAPIGWNSRADGHSPDKSKGRGFGERANGRASLSLRPPEGNWVDDSTTMQRAIANGAVVRASTAPNPWVGAVVTAIDGSIFDGAPSQPSGPHAEVVALAAAGDRALGATLTVTLEPCVHHGRHRRVPMRSWLPEYLVS